MPMGADYLRDSDDAPDVLLVDGFVATGLPARLGSADFFADCLARARARWGAGGQPLGG